MSQAINNAQQQPTPAELMAMINQLRAENERLKQPQPKKSLKAIKSGTSGTVVLTGYRQFPFSFFKAEILDILGRAEEIKAFIVANDATLNQGKDDKRFEAAKAEAAAKWAARTVQA